MLFDAFVAPDPTGASLAFSETERRATAAAAAALAKLACAQEPIHIPGTIQPHGALLAIEPSRDWTVVAASRNAADLLPALLPAGRIVGRSTASILGPRFAEAVQSRFQDDKLRGGSPWLSTFGSIADASLCKMTVHSHADLVLVELERAGMQDGADA